ncbi:mediator of RNA polymerase II transcription subunit 31-like [Haliotis rubra]|uniref:mediator of RNA polymerase II transcription subunit 31-like n=1 Tax=Haliotis rubra TaxID=36100 RepID=UPI001EE509A3|nr:mediator of RNA polymerase II transcription subunit 31-like [Haliotis rubra]
MNIRGPVPMGPDVFASPETEEQQRIRFQVELEFVQCLANPNYLNFLAQRGYFKENYFINYLKYLLYWKEPKYARYINQRKRMSLLQAQADQAAARGDKPIP